MRGCVDVQVVCVASRRLAHTAIALMEAALRRKLMDPDGCSLDRLFEDLDRTLQVLLVDRIKRFNAENEADSKKNATA